MRTFSSYGPVDKALHYYAPREELIDQAYGRLVGRDTDKGGHYITVWAPRQTGKTWIMQQVLKKIRKRDDFETAIVSMQSAKSEDTAQGVLKVLVKKLSNWFERIFPVVDSWSELAELFSKKNFDKPLILILDEFDALGEEWINHFANEFRDMFIGRQNEDQKTSGRKSCLLHGLALIGVRSVLGIENVSGSPFNVQRSLHIPNLTFQETAGMFRWYEQESGQNVEPNVVRRLYEETRGQPGFVGWLGELVTDTYNDDRQAPIDMARFEDVYRLALYALPNNNVVNLVSKANQAPYRNVVLELFKTDRKIVFRYDNMQMNFLYMNGVTDVEESPEAVYARFSSPFVQKRLFGFFSEELVGDTGKLYEPFDDLSDVFTSKGLDMPKLMRRFERYLKANRRWLLAGAPRRSDLRVYEAVFHFCLYRYLCDFMGMERARVWPEFPTGNGKIDLIVEYEGITYAIELKSFANRKGYDDAIEQASRYAKQLGLSEITLVFFVENIDEANRKLFETPFTDSRNGIVAKPVFVATES